MLQVVDGEPQPTLGLHQGFLRAPKLLRKSVLAASSRLHGLAQTRKFLPPDAVCSHARSSTPCPDALPMTCGCSLTLRLQLRHPGAGREAPRLRCVALLVRCNVA